MRTALFDIEADGLRPTRVHCLVTRDADTKEKFVYRPGEIDAGVRQLETFDRIVAHNGIGYDFKVLKRLHGLDMRDEQMLDSIVLSRVLCGHLKEVDLDIYMANGGKSKNKADRHPNLIPGNMIGRHALEAWGWRLGKFKGDYAEEMKAKGLDPWAQFNEEMLEYCENDVDVLMELWTHVLAPQIGGRHKQYTVRAVFQGTNKRICRITLNRDLPEDAYTCKEPIAVGSELIRAAKATHAYDKSMTGWDTVGFDEVPGWLGMHIVDPAPLPFDARVQGWDSNSKMSKPLPTPAYYISRLASSATPKSYRVYRRKDDPNGDLQVQALRTVTISPYVRFTPQDVLSLEHFMARKMEELKASGVKFNVDAAREMEHEMRGMSTQIEHKLKRFFKPRYVSKAMPKRKIHEQTRDVDPNSPMGRLLAAVAPKMITYAKPFRVSSRKEVSERLYEAGYRPSLEDITPSGRAKCTVKDGKVVFTADAAGNIKCSDDSLGKAVAWFRSVGKNAMADAIEDIRVWYLIQKRIGQLANGGQAWLRLVDKDGFLHPTIVPCAAVTARATHANPNISQVPAILKVKRKVLGPDGNPVLGADGKPKTFEEVGWGREGEWGADSRKLFIVPPGFKQVGADLAGIELRMLAHYLHKFDGGRFMEVLLTKDVHEENRRIIGFANRTDAKRFIFALLYGAGDVKLGSIVMPSGSIEQQRAVGRMFRDKVGTGIVGFAELVNEIKDEAASGRIRGLDGRIIPIRAQHAALNTLLQSGGAIVSKFWIRQMFTKWDEKGLLYGYDHDYTFLLWSHDEVQYAVREEHAEFVAKECEASAARAGVELSCAIPIAAESKIGMNWFDTH